MEKIIKTVSKSDVNNLNSLNAVNGKINISTRYFRNTGTEENEPIELHDFSTDEIEILEERKRKNGIEGLECELLINQTTNSIFQVDVDGSILVSDKNVEDKYEINDQGELIFKF